MSPIARDAEPPQAGDGPPPGVMLADTITALPPEAAGRVVLSGSHGGAYPGALALKARLRAVILNDAGGGLEDAGAASLEICAAQGVAAAVVGHRSCRIGDTADMLARGVISRVNGPARAAGARPGMGAREAALALRAAPWIEAPQVPAAQEGRRLARDGAPGRELLLADSAALVRPGEDDGRIVFTGSHGGLIGGDPARALKAAAFAAAFNDAGLGPDECGATRLPALDRRGIAAFTVAADSARIGDAASTLEDGVISRLNARAAALGLEAGMTAREAAARLRRAAG